MYLYMSDSKPVSSVQTGAASNHHMLMIIQEDCSSYSNDQNSQQVVRITDHTGITILASCHLCMQTTKGQYQHALPIPYLNILVIQAALYITKPNSNLKFAHSSKMFINTYTL